VQLNHQKSLPSKLHSSLGGYAPKATALHSDTSRWKRVTPAIAKGLAEGGIFEFSMLDLTQPEGSAQIPAFRRFPCKG